MKDPPVIPAAILWINCVNVVSVMPVCTGKAPNIRKKKPERPKKTALTTEIVLREVAR